MLKLCDIRYRLEILGYHAVVEAGCRIVVSNGCFDTQVISPKGIRYPCETWSIDSYHNGEWIETIQAGEQIKPHQVAKWFHQLNK